MNAVREDHQALAEAVQELAVCAEMHDRVDIGRVRARVRAATLSDPNRFAVLVDVDCARRTPGPTFRQFEMVVNRLVWIRRIVHGRHRRLRENVPLPRQRTHGGGKRNSTELIHFRFPLERSLRILWRARGSPSLRMVETIAGEREESKRDGFVFCSAVMGDA